MEGGPPLISPSSLPAVVGLFPADAGARRTSERFTEKRSLGISLDWAVPEMVGHLHLQAMDDSLKGKNREGLLDSPDSGLPPSPSPPFCSLSPALVESRSGSCTTPVESHHGYHGKESREGKLVRSWFKCRNAFVMWKPWAITWEDPHVQIPDGAHIWMLLFSLRAPVTTPQMALTLIVWGKEKSFEPNPELSQGSVSLLGPTGFSKCGPGTPRGLARIPGAPSRISESFILYLGEDVWSAF